MVTVFNEQIKILIELQKIDGEIFHLKKELANQPVMQKKIESDFDKKKISLRQAEDALKVLQMKLKEKEVDLQVKEEKIKKLQSQLYQLKSNKEYSAMELEIKGIKADNSLLEEEILRAMDAVDGAKTKCVKEKALLADEEKKMKEEIEIIKKKSEEVKAVILSQEEKRKAYFPNVEPKLISQYEKILKNKDGLALVPVKNSSCAGCHMELPPQVVNEIHIQDKLIICESCSRILYWPS